LIDTVVESCNKEHVDNSETNQLPFDRVVMGCLHRGRMTMLATLLQLPVSQLLQKWDASGGPTYEDICQGRSSDRVTTRDGQRVHLALLPTPAHLEAHDATVSGKAFGHVWNRVATAAAADATSSNSNLVHVTPGTMQWKSYTRAVLPLLLHGDASVCGQGMVTESLQLSTCRDFDCGGTIHVILNNQVGFTGETQTLRSTPLVGVSDIAHSIRGKCVY
jgi:2-oxoglutarate dehydrogenase E1 component